MSAAWRASAMWQLVCTASTRRARSAAFTAAHRVDRGRACGGCHAAIAATSASQGNSVRLRVAFVRGADQAMHVALGDVQHLLQRGQPAALQAQRLHVDQRPARPAAGAGRSARARAAAPPACRSWCAPPATCIPPALLLGHARGAGQLATRRCATAAPWRRRRRWSLCAARAGPAARSVRRRLTRPAARPGASHRRPLGPASRTWLSRSSAASWCVGEHDLDRAPRRSALSARAAPWRAPRPP